MSLCVLCLHRVTDSFDSIGLSINSESFMKLVDVLLRTNRILPLEDSLNYIKHNNIFYCITFDDGYCDLQDIAIPYLASLDIPASIFIPTYYVKRQKPFWWEQAAYVLSTGMKIPIEIDNDELDLIGLLKKMNFLEREYFLSSIDIPDFNGLMRSFNLKELKGLPDNIELCNHGHSHTICSQMSEDEFYEEIIRNRKILDSFSNYNSQMFAYPNGTENDFNMTHMKILESLGFKAAFSTISGINLELKRFELKRYVVNQSNVVELMDRLI